MNNVLLVFLEDGKKSVNSFRSDTTEKQALESFNKTSSKKIDRYFFIDNAEYGCDVYMNYYLLNAKGELYFDKTDFLLQHKMETFRTIRNKFLKELDIPFMQAVEIDCRECIDDIARRKNFLRDITKNLNFEGFETEDDFKYYNPFNNIFSLALPNKGAGYEVPPKIVITPPNNDYYRGHQAKAVAFIKDGHIEKIEITDHGCGYHRTPVMTIDPPPEGGVQAVAICFPPENAMEELTQLELTEEEIKDWQKMT